MHAHQPTTAKLQTKTKERIQALESARKRTAHALILDALETFLEKEERREAWRQEGIRAHDDFHVTGLHVTGEEADAWLAKAESGHNAEMPEGHL